MPETICVECSKLFLTERTSWLQNFCDECLKDIKREEEWDDRKLESRDESSI